MHHMSIVLLFNPHSGRGKGTRAARAIAAHLRAQQTHVIEITLERSLNQEDLLHKLDGARALIAVGGDGTVSFAAPAAGRANVPIYHLPLGTENLFSREFGMSAKPDAISRALSRFQVTRIDLATCRGKTVLLVASFGPDASIIHRLAHRRTGAISHRAYITPVLMELRDLTTTRHRVTVDGKVLTCEKPSIVIVANSRQYAGRLNPANNARMDDGLLDVAIMPFRSRARLIAWAGELRFARTTAHRHMHHAQGTHVHVEALDAPLVGQIDGEMLDTTPSREAHIVIQPSAVPVLVP
jgi:diacylglycerol kinase (ATP)